MSKRKKAFIPLIILISAALMTVFSKDSTNAAVTALINTGTKIIPSLFPFMVVSSLIVSTGAAEILGRFFPIAKIFSLPRAASTPIILGALCGFPLGAKSATELYTNGLISKEEAEILISVSNNTGPSFVVGVIGAIYWGNIYVGWFIYAAQLISVVFASLIINKLMFPIKKQSAIKPVPITIKPFFESFSSAVRTASLSCVNICGFIVFFSVITTLVSKPLHHFPPVIMTCVSSILEFSRGASDAAACGGITGAFFSGFAVGFSGISVFCQTCAFTAPLGLSLKRTVCVKTIQGILCGLFCGAYIYMTKIEAITVSTNSYKPTKVTAILLTLAIIFIICTVLYRKMHRKDENSKYA